MLEHGQKWEVHEYPLARSNEEPPVDNNPGAAPLGVVFAKDRMVFVSEGSSGRVALIDAETGDPRSAVDLNRNGFHDSFSADLVLDASRNILYVADPPNSRVVVIDSRLGAIDARPRGILASVALSGPPFAMALSPDRKKLYVTEPESVSVIDASEPAAAKVEAAIHKASGPSGIVAAVGHVYVSNAADDSITVIDSSTNRVETQIAIRIPGLEQLRGVAPAGLAYDEKTGWLLAAEAGINAVGVIDTRSATVLGHIPAGWSPTSVVVDRSTVYVVNRWGQGRGPSAVIGSGSVRIVGGDASDGSVSIYPLPSAAELPGLTEFVMRAAGLAASPRNERSVPSEIRHVVVIEKTSRAFDEILGDVRRAANGPVVGAPALARYGKQGSINGGRERLSLHDVNVTPNQHAIADRWALSDNFYADSAASWNNVGDHLTRNGISFLHFDASKLSGNSSDTERAGGVILEIKKQYVETGADLPQFLHVYLPNDHAGKLRPRDGYPYEESFLVDNDNALGRLLEFLSGTRWWTGMAVFVTDDSVPRGVDHIDAHRTMLLCAGPWTKRNYVSHINSNVAGLWKTVFAILKVPPMSLLDASAADLKDCFASSADTSPYTAIPVDKRVYDPDMKAPAQ